jgi:hypothetical protein
MRNGAFLGREDMGMGVFPLKALLGQGGPSNRFLRPSGVGCRFPIRHWEQAIQRRIIHPKFVSSP